LKTISAIPICILALLLALPAWAGDEEQEEPETIVVTADRTEEDRFEADRSIERIDSEKIRGTQVQSVPHAVQEATGVFLQETNRGAGAPFIRGLVGPQNLILVDGIRFNTSTFRTGPNQYLALIDPFALDRIEIVRGPSSILYGNGAMGGVIQVLIRDPELDREKRSCHARGLVGYSSADHSRRLAAQLSPSRKGFALSAGTNLNWFDSLRAGGGSDQPISGYFSGYGNVKLVYSPDPDWSISAAYLGAFIRDAGRADQAGLGDYRLYHNDDHFLYVLFRWKGNDLVRRVRASLSHHRLDEKIDRTRCDRDSDGVVIDLDACLGSDPGIVNRLRKYHDVVDVLGAEANLGLDFWSHRIRLNTGFELYQEFVSSSLLEANPGNGFSFEPRDRGNFSPGSTYFTFGLYLHGNAALVDFGEKVGQLVLTGGARFSHFAAAADEVPDIGDVDYRFNGFVGSGGIQLVRAGWYNFYVNFVEGFRAPNLQETTVLGDTGSRFEIPNPDLGPERSETLEVGAKVKMGPVALDAAYFHSWMVDAISPEAATYQGRTVIDGKPVTRLENFQDGVFHGVEGNLHLELWRFTLGAGVAWMLGDITDSGGISVPARRIPPLFGTGTVRYVPPDRVWYAEFLVRWAARQDRLHPSDEADPRICETAPYSGVLRDPCNGTAGWTTLTLRGGWQMNEYTRLDLSLSNLTDANYRLHGSGFDAPGFDARLSLYLEY
jgi:hemoglobin/transferrin/lactoferrin receptor protein